MLDATRALQAAGPPLVVTAPASVTVAAGATASFAIEAIGAVSYQWVRNGVAIAGATGPTYTTPPLAATDNNAAFQVNMSNLFGTTEYSGRADCDWWRVEFAFLRRWGAASLAVAIAVCAVARGSRSRRLSRTVARVTCRRLHPRGGLAALRPRPTIPHKGWSRRPVAQVRL